MEKRKNIIVKEIVKMQEGEVDVTYISSFNAYGGAASINPKHPKFNELVFVFRADNELLTNRYKAGFTEVNSGTIKNKTYIHEETDLPVTVHCTNRFKTLADVGMIISEDENGKYVTKFYGSGLQEFKDLDLEITINKKMIQKR